MPALTLYHRATSSCSARLRIALALKGLPYTSVYVSRSQQLDPAFAYAAVNPARTVPTLSVVDPDDTGATDAPPLLITQSGAALAFLEEAFPAAPPLLPPPAARAARARVRALVDLVVSDIQPRQAVQTLRVLEGYVGEDEDEAARTRARRAWAHGFCVDGFAAYEAQLRAGDAYSVGDAPTLADCCLVPMVWNAVERWGVDLAAFPRLAAVYGRLMALPAVAGAHGRHQPDAGQADA